MQRTSRSEQAVIGDMTGPLREQQRSWKQNMKEEEQGAASLLKWEASEKKSPDRQSSQGPDMSM